MALTLDTTNLHVIMDNGKVFDGSTEGIAKDPLKHTDKTEIKNIQAKFAAVFMKGIEPAETKLQLALDNLSTNSTDPSTLAKFQMEFASFSTLTSVSSQVTKAWKDNVQGLARSL